MARPPIRRSWPEPAASGGRLWLPGLWRAGKSGMP